MTKTRPGNSNLGFFSQPPSALFGSIVSPQLVVDESAVNANLDRMIQMVGGSDKVNQLRPHLKTHKSGYVTRMHLEKGIRNFKASTLGEVAMAANAGASSVLLAHQPVGPKVQQFVELIGRFPGCRLSVVVDDASVVQSLADEACDPNVEIDVLIDVDCGMHRTGVQTGDSLNRLVEVIHKHDSLNLLGLHVYDGHLHDPSLGDRRNGVQRITQELVTAIAKHHPGVIVVGGTPTFGLWIEEAHRHDLRSAWQFSPGTSTLWDWGYADAYPDLSFEIAAAVLTRVISQPHGGDDSSRQLVCFDLGYKAIASEMLLHDRLIIVGLPGSQIVSHSEEHLVVSVPRSEQLAMGQAFWALPRHICPTVARYEHAAIVSPSTGSITQSPIQGRSSPEHESFD